MLHDEEPDRDRQGRNNLSVAALAFLALSFFLIAGAIVYIQGARDGAVSGAAVLK